MRLVKKATLYVEKATILYILGSFLTVGNLKNLYNRVFIIKSAVDKHLINTITKFETV